MTYQPDGVSPYQITYNLDVQRQLWTGTILSVGYVGSVTRHLWTQGDINPPMCTTYPNCTALPIAPKSRADQLGGGITLFPVVRTLAWVQVRTMEASQARERAAMEAVCNSRPPPRAVKLVHE